MIPGVYNKAIYQGDDDALIAIWSSGGAVVNLTGYSAKMQVKLSKNTAAALATFTTADGSIIIDGVNGKVTVPITAAMAASLNPGDYYYDLQLTAGSGANSTILSGTFSVVQQVTL